MDSPFEVLGIDADADDDEVLEAYRERVKEVHPDQGGSAREFQAVREAYERIEAGYDPDGEMAGPTAPGQQVDQEEQRAVSHRVEYVNYQVLDDFGWELTDDDLFEKAAEADLPIEDYGAFDVDPGDSILEAAENCGFSWPFACRGGACSNCAIALIDGEIPPPTSHVLPPELIDRGIRLSCITTPVTEDTKIVYNVKHLPGVNELLLPASRFEKASTD
ncbi:ferredoxin Fer [Halorientalis salina]|uniref:ferredoxin Fer n=1 Tax=Halorientalis salina TaxID=2932266 RepID=UPI0010ABF91B|nr:ferredoxin Fer [Halorientalis salina]